MKALVHIGTEKTGSTTIQHFLNLNKTKLKQQNIVYLTTSKSTNAIRIATYCMDDNRIDNNVRRLGLIDKKSRIAWKQKFKQNLDKQFRIIADHKNSVIISSEHFHSRLITTTEIENLYELLAPYFTEIKIIVYIRRQDRLAVSLYSTMLKNGKHRSTVLPHNIQSDDPFYNFFNSMETWSRVFGNNNLIIRIFEKEKFFNQDLIDDFINASQLTQPSDFTIPERKNQNLSGAVQEALTIINSIFPSYNGNVYNRFNQHLVRYVIEELSVKYEDQQKLPSRHKAVEFYNSFIDSNHQLSNKYFAGDNIFSQDFSMYPDIEMKEITRDKIIEDILKAVSKYINEQKT